MKPAARMNKFVLLALIAIALLLASTPFVYAAEPGSAVGQSLDKIWDKTKDITENFYEKSPKTVDFILLFMLFTVSFLIGLKNVYQGKDGIGRQIVVLAAVLGAICSIALVFGMGFSIVKLKYIALGLLFFIIVFVVYSMLLKIGMENHKFLAFILALLIVAGLFFLGSALLGTEKEGWISGLFEKEGTAGEFGEMQVKKTCVSTEDNIGIRAFQWKEFEFKTGEEAKIKTWVKKCEGNIIVEGWSSVEGEEDFNKELSQSRADAVKAAIVSAGKTVKSATGMGTTWKFTKPAPSAEIKKQGEAYKGGNPGKYEESLAPNRAYVIKCDCYVYVPAKGTTAEISKACDKASGFNIGDIAEAFRSQDEITKMEQTIELCRRAWEASKGTNREAGYKTKFLDAYYKLYSTLGKEWFELKEYEKAEEKFNKIINAPEKYEITEKYTKQAKEELEKIKRKEFGSCVQKSDFNMKRLFAQFKAKSKEVWAQTAEPEIRIKYALLQQCKKELEAKTESDIDYTEYKTRYYDAHYEYYISQGEGWFDADDYTKAKGFFEKVTKEEDTPQKYRDNAVDKWYSLVESHYKDEFGYIKTLSQRAYKQELGKELMDDIDKSIKAKETGKLHAPKTFRKTTE